MFKSVAYLAGNIAISATLGIFSSKCAMDRKVGVLFLENGNDFKQFFIDSHEGLAKIDKKAATLWKAIADNPNYYIYKSKAVSFAKDILFTTPNIAYELTDSIYMGIGWKGKKIFHFCLAAPILTTILKHLFEESDHKEKFENIHQLVENACSLIPTAYRVYCLYTEKRFFSGIVSIGLGLMNLLIWSNWFWNKVIPWYVQVMIRDINDKKADIEAGRMPESFKSFITPEEMKKTLDQGEKFLESLLKTSVIDDKPFFEYLKKLHEVDKNKEPLDFFITLVDFGCLTPNLSSSYQEIAERFYEQEKKEILEIISKKLEPKSSRYKIETLTSDHKALEKRYNKEKVEDRFKLVRKTLYPRTSK